METKNWVSQGRCDCDINGEKISLQDNNAWFVTGLQKLILGLYPKC